MPEQRCLNCDAITVDAARFCTQCGQRTDTARLTLHDVIRDLMHSFVNVERGPLTFAWALLTEPGNVAREFVEGKRRRHFGPFATLVVLVGMASLVINLSGFQALAHDGLPATPTELLQRHFNLLLLAQLPLIGLACAIVFHRSHLTLAEHMVLAAYALGARAVFLALVVPVAYLSADMAPGALYFTAFWFAWYVYFGWAASQFYPGPRWRSWIGGFAAAAIGHAAIMAALFGGSDIYKVIAG